MPLNLEHAGSRVDIVTYDPAWPEIYETERHGLESALGDAVAAVHHGRLEAHDLKHAVVR